MSEAEGGIGLLERPVPSPITAEQEAVPEQERGPLNGATARIIAGTIDTKFMQPEGQTFSDEERTALTEKIRHARTHDISYTAVTNLSIESRRAELAGKEAVTFKDQNDQWNKQAHAWLEKHTAVDAAPPDVLADRKAALESLGLAVPPETTTNSDNNLYSNLESFRQRYFKGTSDVKSFVEDLAKDCREGEYKPVDIALLQRRLDSIKDVLGAFGKDAQIGQLVREYGIAYAVLTQKPSVREQYAQDVTTLLKQPIEDPEKHSLYQKLWEKQNHIIEVKAEELKTEKQIEQQKGEKKLTDEQINELVNQAKNTAASRADVLKYENARYQLEGKFQNGDLDYDTYKAGLEALDRDYSEIAEAGIIKVDTKGDFLAVLIEAGIFNDKKILEDTKHEEDHFKEAEAKGFHPQYEFRILKDESDELIGQSSTIWDNPDTMSAEDLKKHRDEINMAPGLKNISDRDRVALGISAEEYSYAVEIQDRYAIPSMTPMQEIAFVRFLHDQQKSVEQRISGTNPQPAESDPKDPPPDEKISEADLFKRFADSAAQALRSKGAYDTNAHSESAFQHAAENRGGEKPYDVKNWRTILEEQTKDQNMTVQTTTNLDALLHANEQGDAVIIPYNETHFAVLEPSGKNYHINSNGEISVRLYTPDEANPNYISLSSLFRNELALYESADPITKQEQYAGKSRAFILRSSA